MVLYRRKAYEWERRIADKWLKPQDMISLPVIYGHSTSQRGQKGRCSWVDEITWTLGGTGKGYSSAQSPVAMKAAAVDRFVQDPSAS